MFSKSKKGSVKYDSGSHLSPTPFFPTPFFETSVAKEGQGSDHVFVLVLQQRCMDKEVPYAKARKFCGAGDTVAYHPTRESPAFDTGTS